MIRTSVATSQNINSSIKAHCHIITRNCIKRTEIARAGESVTVVINIKAQTSSKLTDFCL